MAFTVTSSVASVAVTPTTAIITLPNHGAGLAAYITYTKGTEGGIYIAPSVTHKEVSSTTYYQYVGSDSLYALTPLKYSISATGSYRIPLTWIDGEDKLKLTFSAISGSASGTIDVEIRGGE